PNPTITPNVTENCQSDDTWLDSTMPSPSKSPPLTATMRVPMRSESDPQRNEPSPIATQLISATLEIALRLQPTDSSIGVRKTPSEKRMPMPMQMISAEAPTTTQP